MADPRFDRFGPQIASRIRTTDPSRHLHGISTPLDSFPPRFKVGVVGLGKFDERILELVEGMPELVEIMEPLLAARQKLRETFATLCR
jgi:hypothetical protein